MGILALPLDITANWIGQWRGDGAASEVLLQRIRKIIDGDARRIAGRIDTTPCVDQLAVLIKDIEMGCSQSTISSCHILALVMKVDPWELILLHAIHHMRERILGIRVFAVRINRDKLHSLRCKALGGAAGHLVGINHIRTMIAGEEDHEDRNVLKILKGMGLSVGRK